MLTFPDVKMSSITFGESAGAYGPLINDIAPYLCRESYVFEDSDTFKLKASELQNGAAYAGRIYWIEILNRAHLNSVTSIIRTCRWADVVTREYEARNLFGWAASCRSLIEAAGDTGHALGPVPLTLAERHREIKVALNGASSNTVITCQELEDTLIHFSHARKVAKTDTAPASHKARSSSEYIGFLENMKISGIRDVYADFCEIVHPAAQSISTMIGDNGRGWLVNATGEQRCLEAKVLAYRVTMAEVLAAALNPPLLILKILHEFDIFTKIKPMKNYKFDNIPMWKKMTDALMTV